MHGIRKSAHFAGYLVLGALLLSVIKSYYQQFKSRFIIATAAAAFYACTDELHQLFVPGRTGRITDVFIDTAGAALGALLTAYVYSRLKHKSNKKNKKVIQKKQRSFLFSHLIYMALSIQAITTIALLYLTLAGHQLTTKLALQVAAISGAFLLVSSGQTYAAAHAKRGKLWRLLAALVISLAIFINCVGITILYNAQNFTRTIQPKKYTYIVYDIFTNKNNPGNISTDTLIVRQNEPHGAEIDKQLKRRGPVMIGAPTISELLVGLENDQAKLGALPESLISSLKENAPDAYSQLKVLKQIVIKTEATNSKTKLDVAQPFIVYISGLDTYGDIATVSRSDVNMLMVVNPVTNKILLVNTPRDYYVQLHGTSGLKDKLTHAGIYGIEMSKATLEDLYQTPIQEYAKINFSTLLGVIEALGGVSVQSDKSFCDGGYCFRQGANDLNARQALAFARARHPFADGDRQRGRDQQLVIEAIIAKLNDPGSLVRYNRVLGALSGSLQTNASPSDINRFMRSQMDSLKPWSVQSISVTGADDRQPTYSMGAGLPLYVMQPDQASLQAAR
ncbi:MAG TPA: VanZ family protein, partial [Candidatus Saccharibacteria bacterium]|nr:VanZ family protein [Candidatus Saccharibacteria bacterium]